MKLAEKQIKALQEQLCRSFCADIKIIRNAGSTLIETPFSFPDGDSYQIYLNPLARGGFRVSDGGHTLMHLSYENDIDKFNDGNRKILLENIKNEFDVKSEDGEFFVDCTAEEIAKHVFKLGQALTKISDITFLNKARVQSTFYEDLREQLIKIFSVANIEEDYIFDKLANAKDYPIDYKLSTERERYYPFIFAVHNSDKAQQTTIILERLLRTQQDKKDFEFNSLIVFNDMNTIGGAKIKRLINVAGPSVSLDDKENFNRKAKQLIA
ncbi:hypothetical protein COTS27_00140 [Spirochaetota bacterium]|nr:hypothetical protein COTS27_00140 [Spirochaetota bacterium]